MNGDAPDLTPLLLAVFRANGALLDAGDALVWEVGLTSARGQGLGALDGLGEPATVSQVARAMGLTRQSVQRVADDLAKAGLVKGLPNPEHARAKLIVMTSTGRAAFEDAARRQKPWVTALAQGLAADDVAAAQRVLSAIIHRLAAGA